MCRHHARVPGAPRPRLIRSPQGGCRRCAESGFKRRRRSAGPSGVQGGQRRITPPRSLANLPRLPDNPWVISGVKPGARLGNLDNGWLVVPRRFGSEGRANPPLQLCKQSAGARRESAHDRRDARSPERAADGALRPSCARLGEGVGGAGRGELADRHGSGRHTFRAGMVPPIHGRLPTTRGRRFRSRPPRAIPECSSSRGRVQATPMYTERQLSFPPPCSA